MSSRPVILALALAAALVLALPTAAMAARAERPGVTTTKVRPSPQRALEYWTPERMRRARPPELTRDRAPRSSSPGSASGVGAPSYVMGAPPGADRVHRVIAGELAGAGHRGAARHVASWTFEQPATTEFAHRTHGKVFATMPGRGDYVCSATVVPGNTGGTVITAGHCVYDRSAGGFARNWIFVPGYRDGWRPFGAWAAKRLVAPAGFVGDDDDVSLDVGAAEMRPNHAGWGVEYVVGSRGIGFSQPRGQFVWAYGYPATSPYTGGRLWICASDVGGAGRGDLAGPPPLEIGCSLTSAQAAAAG